MSDHTWVPYKKNAADSVRGTCMQRRFLFHRRTRASYVYNVCLAWYNVVLTPRVHSSVKFVGWRLVRQWNKCVIQLSIVV